MGNKKLEVFDLTRGCALWHIITARSLNIPSKGYFVKVDKFLNRK